MALYCLRVCCLAFSSVTASALAQQAPELPLWEVGVLGFAVSQQAYPGASEQINRGLVVPTFIYRGQYLRAGEGGASVRAIKTPTFEFDVGFAAAFGSGGRDIAIRKGMPQLGTMVEFGPRLTWNLMRTADGGRLRAEFPLRGVFDLSNSLSSKGLSFEPELQFDQRRKVGWSYYGSIGALIGNSRLNDTFYGVAPQYVRPDRPGYVARSGLISLRASAGVSRPLSPDWRLFLFGRIDDVHLGANDDSPLVRKKTGASLGFGLAYTLRRSAAMTQD